MGLDKKARKSISEVEEKVHKRLAALNLDKKNKDGGRYVRL